MTARAWFVLLVLGCGSPEDEPPCAPAGTFSTPACVNVCVDNGYAFGTCDEPRQCTRLRAYEFAPLVQFGDGGAPAFTPEPCGFGE